MGKVNASRIWEQKQYLPFPYRDILDVINGSGISDEYVFTLAFEISCPFHCFIVFKVVGALYIQQRNSALLLLM